ncbi:MAG: polyprenyl synthetase family protein [Rhodospirillales bacterium]|nr:polyprenyl synthetase family protein [Rhodospirillales bacterium]MCB9965849.1 polyprenyl synthetase family protein [Rhodospirillales bacterium]MCB9979650.1 polyprenyl synthetase family protein [Rhodospirillales bacterium]
MQSNELKDMANANGADVSPLERLVTFLRPDMDAVNAEITARMTSDVPLITNIAKYLISAGGKRLRPLLTLAAARSLDGDMTRAYGLAATVEFIHTATLLHDDVVDASHERRGQAVANDVFGNQASVLVGDFLFSRAFQLMVADGSLETLRILSDASAIIAEGEVLQLQMQRHLETGWEDYLQMIGAKTAALFAAACEVGAVVSAASPDLQKSLHEYGFSLGIAFQMADDLLDYAAEEEKLGKKVGDDFREGKISAPVLLAYAKADAAEKDFWRRTIGRGEQTEDDLAQAQQIMSRHNIIEEGLALAESYAQAAQRSLEPLPASHVKELLHQIAAYVVRRTY